MNAFTAQSELDLRSNDLLSRAQPKALPAASRVAAAVRWFLEMPRRRAVINELQSLTDHELADIGLSRGELSRVFDRGFAMRQDVSA